MTLKDNDTKTNFYAMLKIFLSSGTNGLMGQAVQGRRVLHLCHKRQPKACHHMVLKNESLKSRKKNFLYFIFH